MTAADFLDTAIYLSFWMVMLSLAVGFIRLARGPGLANRVVALDMMTINIIAVCGVSAVGTGVVALLDVALVLALVGFLATVALARYAERRDLRNQEDDRD